MNNLVHLVYIPFRGVGIDLRDDEWFKERIEIFKKYTLQSLRNQTCQDFVTWLSFRPEDENSILVKELSDYLKSIDFSFVMTFNGLMYYDDKFSKDWKNRIKNLGRVIRWCYRNTWKDFFSHAKFMFNNKNDTLKERLSRSLSFLLKYFRGVEWILMTRIDSDDMFHRKAIEIIQSYPRFAGALVCKKGFIYNETTGEMAEWNPPTNPPFHTIQFPENVWNRPNHLFFDVDRHMEFYKDFRSHEDVTRVFETMELPEYFYCVLTHNPKNHISTIWNHPFRGELVESEFINLYR